MAKTTIKDIDNTSRQITVEVTQDELKHAKEAVLKQLQPDVSAPGFRKGKAPLNVVEKQADKDYLQSQVLDHALNDAFNQAVRDKKLRAVGQPKVDLKKFVPFSQLEATFTITVVPDIKLPDYKKMTVKRDEVSVDQEEVDGVVNNLRTRLATRDEVKRAAKEGDEVVIDFEGTDEKEEKVAGASGKDYTLVLGSQTFIPGFEENIIGMKPGEDKTFEVTFPKDYAHAPLAGAKVSFAVTLKKVNEMNKPALDKEFASKVGPFSSVKEMKSDIEKQLKLQKEREETSRYRDQIVEAISEKAKVELPKLLVDEQIESQMVDLKQNLVYRGMTLQEYLKQVGKTEEEYKESEMKEQAERRVKAGLVLSEIAEREKIDVTPEELEIRLQLMRGQYQSDQQMLSQLDTPQAKQNVYSQLMTEKTLAKLEEYVAPKK